MHASPWLASKKTTVELFNLEEGLALILRSTNCAVSSRCAWARCRLTAHAHYSMARHDNSGARHTPFTADGGRPVLTKVRAVGVSVRAFSCHHGGGYDCGGGDQAGGSSRWFLVRWRHQCATTGFSASVSVSVRVVHPWMDRFNGSVRWLRQEPRLSEANKHVRQHTRARKRGR